MTPEEINAWLKDCPSNYAVILKDHAQSLSEESAILFILKQLGIEDQEIWHKALKILKRNSALIDNHIIFQEMMGSK